jgi:hypothetical protein
VGTGAPEKGSSGIKGKKMKGGQRGLKIKYSANK